MQNAAPATVDESDRRTTSSSSGERHAGADTASLRNIGEQHCPTSGWPWEERRGGALLIISQY